MIAISQILPVIFLILGLLEALRFSEVIQRTTTSTVTSEDGRTLQANGRDSVDIKLVEGHLEINATGTSRVAILRSGKLAFFQRGTFDNNISVLEKDILLVELLERSDRSSIDQLMTLGEISVDDLPVGGDVYRVTIQSENAYIARNRKTRKSTILSVPKELLALGEATVIAKVGVVKRGSNTLMLQNEKGYAQITLNAPDQLSMVGKNCYVCIYRNGELIYTNPGQEDLPTSLCAFGDVESTSTVMATDNVIVVFPNRRRKVTQEEFTELFLKGQEEEKRGLTEHLLVEQKLSIAAFSINAKPVTDTKKPVESKPVAEPKRVNGSSSVTEPKRNIEFKPVRSLTESTVPKPATGSKPTKPIFSSDLVRPVESKSKNGPNPLSREPFAGKHQVNSFTEASPTKPVFGSALSNDPDWLKGSSLPSKYNQFNPLAEPQSQYQPRSQPKTSPFSEPSPALKPTSAPRANPTRGRPLGEPAPPTQSKVPPIDLSNINPPAKPGPAKGLPKPANSHAPKEENPEFQPNNFGFNQDRRITRSRTALDKRPPSGAARPEKTIYMSPELMSSLEDAQRQYSAFKQENPKK
jgi:hypothetical protein